MAPASSQIVAHVAGVRTEILLIAYTNCLLVVVTQLGSLGTVLRAEKQTVLGSGITHDVVVLLGRRDDPMAELCARQLGERLVEAGCASPLLLCLALDNLAAVQQTVQQVVDQVLKHPVWLPACGPSNA
jgi:proteasome assembly chaperone 3